MAKSFKFKILDAADPSAEYAAITTKDPETFYLLANGFGYFGSVPLFNGGKKNVEIVSTGQTLSDPVQNVLYVMDGGTYSSEVKTGLFLYNGTALVNYSDKILAAYMTGVMVTDMLSEGYTGNNTTIPTTKALVDLVNAKITGGHIMNVKFFRKVESHTIIADDLTNENISKPAGVAVGDVGLLFTADNDGEEGNEFYYFIGLKDYIKIYSVKDSTSIKTTMSSGNEITSELFIKSGETSIAVDATNGGVYLKKSTIIDDDAPSEDNLVTEKSMTDYVQSSVIPAVNQAIADALANVVTYEYSSGS